MHRLESLCHRGGSCLVVARYASRGQSLGVVKKETADGEGVEKGLAHRVRART